MHNEYFIENNILGDFILLIKKIAQQRNTTYFLITKKKEMIQIF